MRLKAGYGYFVTDRHPIGGEFDRAGKEGKEIKEVLRTWKITRELRGCHGCNAEVLFTDGTKGALHTENIEY